MNKITLIIGILFLFSFASVFAITVKLSSPINLTIVDSVAIQSQEIIRLNNKINSLETRISALEKLLGVIPKP